MNDELRSVEEFIEGKIKWLEELKGAKKSQINHYLREYNDIEKRLEGFKEAQAIFQQYKVSDELRERLIKSDTYIINPRENNP